MEDYPTGIRGKWVYDPKLEQLVPVGEPKVIESGYIVMDTMDPVFHPATGEYLDSKSSYRRLSKKMGYVEIDDDQTWEQVGERRPKAIEGLKEDLEEVRYWYTMKMKGNSDYVNANVPAELRDCEEVDILDITKGI